MEGTIRSTRNAPRAAVLCLTGILLAACDPSEREPGIGRDSVPGPAAGEAAPQTPPASGDEGLSPGGSIAAPADTVDVILTDFAIQMPATVRSGPTAFRVRNAGAVDHDLEVESDQVEESLPEDLPPGESRILVVDLTPGTWEVYCPVGDHDDRGMRLQLAVQ
jgi:hypothetical protein